MRNIARTVTDVDTVYGPSAAVSYNDPHTGNPKTMYFEVIFTAGRPNGPYCVNIGLRAGAQEQLNVSARSPGGALGRCILGFLHVVPADYLRKEISYTMPEF